MRANKNIAKHIGKVTSIKEILIDTISETMDKPLNEVKEALENSECNVKLSDMKSDYYSTDINNIILDFTKECEDKYSWIQT